MSASSGIVEFVNTTVPIGPASAPGTTGAQGQAHHDKKVARWVFLAPALLAFSLIANGAWQASHRGTANHVSGDALAEAYVKAPFTIRLPTTAPQNAQITRVFLDEPDSRQGFQAYQLNVWYRTPGQTAAGGGRAVHIWQSNDKFLARRLADPLQAVGVKETIGGAAWHRVIDDRVAKQIVTTFSRRYDDGITVTVDSKDPGLARATIERLSSDPVRLS